MKSEVRLLSGGTPDKSKDRYWGGTIPWVSSGEMTQRRISDTVLHVTDEGVAKGTKLVPENTVLVVVRGMSLAKEFRVSLTTRPVTFNQDLKALDPSVRIDPGFLFYYLQSQQHAICDSATDASHGTKKLESSVLESWPLPVPDLKEQYAIRDVLSAYDDLIENNRRRIALLGEAARLLYREWFVHLRFPGHEHVAIKDGVPDGWEKRPFAKLLKSHIGGGWGQDSYDSNENQPAYVIRGTDFAAVERGQIHEVGLRYHKESSLKKRILSPGDILFEVSGGSANQPIGRTLLVNSEILKTFDHPVICASFCKRFVPLDNAYSQLLNRFLKHIRESGELLIFKKDSASALQNFDFKAFLTSQMVTVPNRAILDQFTDCIQNIEHQKSYLAISIHRLSEARDLLLPHLMNGEIAV